MTLTLGIVVAIVITAILFWPRNTPYERAVGLLTVWKRSGNPPVAASPPAAPELADTSTPPVDAA